MTQCAVDGPWIFTKPQRPQAQQNTQKTATPHTCLLGDLGNAHDARMAASILYPVAAQKLAANSFLKLSDTANLTEI